MSVYEKVYDKLEADNFSVFPPNTHVGDVTDKYVVLGDGGRYQAGTNSSQTV